MRLNRLLSITFVLLSRGQVSSTELAEKFGVSQRTIYRDIDTIAESGIPITAVPGKAGGFSIMDSYKMDKRYLSPDELATVLSTLKGLGNTFSSAELTNAIEKISVLAPREKQSEIEELMNRVVFDVLPMGYTEKQRELLASLYEAVKGNRVVEFTYSNAKGEAEKRAVEPMRLMAKGYSWYIFAYCRLRSDFRTFKLTRISELRLAAERFEPRSVNYADYEYDRSKLPTVELVLRFSQYIRPIVEEMYQASEMEQQPDGSLVVRKAMAEDEWLYAYLLSWGESLEILEPMRIREIIIKKAKNILSVYNR